MRNNPARLAWTILLGAFLLFCVIAVSVPLGIRYYLLHAVDDRPATLTVSSGTVLVAANGSNEPIAVLDTRTIEGETLIQTDQSSRALIAFPAHAGPDSPDLATMQVYNSAQVNLVESTTPRFPLSSDPDRLVLEVRGGRMRINTADLQPRGLYTEVRTPHATAYLGDGSYSVEVNNDQTQISTRQGEASVEASGRQATVAEGQRTVITVGQAPSEPVPSPENLIANGNFEDPVGPPTWLVSRYPEDPSSGDVEITNADGRNAARFRRINQPPTHTEVGITQVLDRSVQDFEELVLQLDVLLRWQSLPGAGEQSSEFPLMLWLDYIDVYGNHQFWTHGFYYRDPSEQWVVTGGEKIQPNVWFPFESGNLFERLTMEGRPPPATINWIKIYASGHNYDSQVSEVRLIAR